MQRTALLDAVNQLLIDCLRAAAGVCRLHEDRLDAGRGLRRAHSRQAGERNRTGEQTA
jgi:hypothetical protein